MSEVLHADIFFFITALAVVAVSAAFLVALYYAIRILRDVRAIVAAVRRASGGAERDFDLLRGELRTEGVKVRTLFDLFLAALGRRLRPRKKGDDL